MRNFNLAEVGELYQQHTAATGQIFTPEAGSLTARGALATVWPMTGVKS